MSEINKKNPAAVLGQKGGKKRAENLSAEALRAIGRAGAEARWKKKRAEEANIKAQTTPKAIGKRAAR